MDLKNKSILIGFVLMLLGITMAGIKKKIRADKLMSIKKNSSSGQFDEKSFFKDSYYYVKNKGERPFFLRAKNIVMNPKNKEISFVMPRGTIYEDKGEKVFYQADGGHLDQKQDVLFLDKKVKVNTGSSVLKSKKLRYNFPKMKLIALGDVRTRTSSKKTGDKVFIKSLKLVSLGQKKEIYVYSGKVRGTIKRKRVYEESVHFNSNNLNFNKKKLKAHLEGKVVFKYKKFKAWAQKGEIFLENYNNNLKYFALYDDVKVKEVLSLQGKNVIRKAFSEKLEGFPGKSKAILTGYPKVIQADDTIVGNKIILRWNNEVLEIIDANSNLKVKK